MKHFLLLFILCITSYTTHAQKPNNYSKDWAEIDSLDRISLPKSALAATQKLHKKIKKDKKNPSRTAQLIKSTIYLNKYYARLEEDGQIKTIHRFEKEAQEADIPTKPILLSMVAQMYQQYLYNNIYKYQNRTNVEGYNLEDIRTWSIPQITDKVFELYWQSLSYKETKTLNINNLKEILEENNFSKNNLHPTVYDLLVHRALNFFMNETSYLTQPAYQFYIESPKAFGDAKTFIQHEFKTRDSLSAKWQSIRLFQDVLEFHIDDKSAQALITTDIRRLRFVYQNSMLTNKDELYQKRLEAMIEQYAKHEACSEVYYALAAYYYQRGTKYNAQTGKEYRWDWKKAHELCTEAMNKYKVAYGARQCLALKTSIENKSIGLQVEHIYSRNKPMLVKANYRNVDKLHCKLIKLNQKQYMTFLRKRTQEKRLKYINSFDPIKSWETIPKKTKETNDYRAHNTEMSLPGQGTGYYMVLSSDKDSFNYNKNSVAYATFHVSDIAYVHYNKDGLEEYYVTDRTTGKPLEKVAAHFSIQRYNFFTFNEYYLPAHTVISDKNGFIHSKKVPKTKKYKTYKVKFVHKDDHLDLSYDFSNYYNEQNSNYLSHPTTHFFLDRAIYRPGQKVYFKGLVIANDGSSKEPQIQANYKTEIIFYNANGQEIERQEVTTNEYGTFNGSFNAPEGGLTGSMRLYDTRTYASKYLRVEEYKRPKFEVKFKPVKESYKIDDSVVIHGYAKAFAGSVIDRAKVHYRVVRQARFPYWSYRYGRNPYNRAAQEITNGDITTNEKGEYKITFKALADKDIPKDRKPIFTYTVYADVTDITGETRSSQKAVRVGYIALDVALDIAETTDRDKNKAFEIKTKNLNGEFEPASGNITIEQLKTPEVAYISRYWAIPDQYSISEADFKKDFPYLTYKNEEQYQNWPVVKTAYTGSFNTKDSKEVEPKWNTWPQGKYRIKLSTQDKYGEKIELEKYITLYSNTANEVPLNQSLFLAKNIFTAEPGEEVAIELGSYNKDAYILIELEHDNKVIKKEWIQPNGKTNFKFTPEEAHRGNVHFTILTIQNNRFQSQQGTIIVPWSNKDLQIEYTTFRDKLAPGQPEEWRIKLKGPKGEKIAAEMLATMYDASLDAFAVNNWSLNIFPNSYNRFNPAASDNFTTAHGSAITDYHWNKHFSTPSYRQYPNLKWFGLGYYNRNYNYETSPSGYAYEEREQALMSMEVATVSSRSHSRLRLGGAKRRYAAPTMAKASAKKENSKEMKRGRNESARDVQFEDEDSDGVADILDTEPNSDGDGDGDGDFGDVKIRTNLNETVFFFPDLMTDEEGNIVVKFTMNEALTRWKFMAFAHTKDLKRIISTKEIVTQKSLMVMPNAPRFLRQNDKIEFTAKVSNLTEDEMTGQAVLQLFDALSMKPVDAAFGNTKAKINFTAKGGQSDRLAWQLEIPDTWTTPITYRVIAKASNFSDGEESGLPVLTNRMLVTETQPMPVRGETTKKFQFKRIEELSSSTSLRNHKLTLEFTPNPAWYAIQSLPYLMEYPHECTEQIFSRYYANSLASGVANAHPKIKAVFDTWRTLDTAALQSNLQKNEELKYALLSETPWVMQAQSEEQQKKNIGILFELNRMSKELKQARNKMAKRQAVNGGFSWFPGGRDSWYITQYIVEGVGHMKYMGVSGLKDDDKMLNMAKRALKYTDQKMAKAYRDLLRDAELAERDRGMTKEEYLALDHLGNMVIHYLYSRSFFDEYEVTNETTLEAIKYYKGQAQKYWMNKSDYMQGMLSLAMYRADEKDATAHLIVKSLKERAMHSEEMGMYWKYPSGYYWYQLPIETHSLMIEVFQEVAKDEDAVEELKVWLLKSRQTTHWATTKGTAAACYALLMTGDNWLLEDADLKITIAGKKLDQSKIKKEAGTGYFKTTWEADEITPKMGNITVKNPNKVPAWGALYWQYFEDMDKVTHFQETPLKLDKKLFKQIDTDRGPVLKPITSEKLKPGDLIKVRIELRVDRNMEYVHMKDMRASGLEPVNVLSGYKYQDGLGYYESTKDLATHFFFSYLSKGTYVFEYPLRVNHKGDFSNGMTTIQCMYAPEFTAHSEGVRVKVE